MFQYDEELWDYLGFVWDLGFKICIINMFQYDEELAFFGIMPDVIGDCCYEDYRDR